MCKDHPFLASRRNRKAIFGRTLAFQRGSIGKTTADELFDEPAEESQCHHWVEPWMLAMDECLKCGGM
jgi:hypothetical protein